MRVTSSKSKSMHAKAIEERERVLRAIRKVMGVDLDATDIDEGSGSYSNGGASHCKGNNGDDDDASPDCWCVSTVQLSLNTTLSSKRPRNHCGR